MKIGLVCPYNLFKGGGVQECVLALREELTRRGHEALIITPHHRAFPKKLPDYVRLLGRATDISSFQTTAQVSISADVREIDELLGAEKFDVLHLHEPWVPLIAAQLLARNRVPTVATFHAKLPETVMSRTIEKVVTPYTKNILGRIDVLTAVSEAAADYVKTLTRREINIVPNGVDLAKFTHSTSNKHNILFIGRLEKRKGLRYLLEALSLVQQNFPDVSLSVAGDGPYKSRLIRQAKDLGIKNVEFLGYVSEERKLQLFKQASLFCSPALHGESFGIVLLEAMASNVPIVAADNPGYKSVMKQRGILSLVNVLDVESFARQLELMISDQEVRKLWRAWASEYVQQFDYPKIVAQYEQLYKKARK